ncbi:MAG: hypothetical protein AAGC60_08700 [Acidobacteriota bacterium]
MSRRVLYVATAIPDDLARDLDRLLQRIRAAEDATAHRDEGIELIQRLTDAGLEGFFLRPVESMGLGLVARKATAVGLRTASSAIGVFVRRIGRGFTDEQVRALADLLDDMVLEVEEDEPDDD